MFWLTLVKDIIKILRAGENPGQVAGGFALGTLLGLSPGFTLQEFLLWFILLPFFIRSMEAAASRKRAGARLS